jgi:hypothetical protein
VSLIAFWPLGMQQGKTTRKNLHKLTQEVDPRMDASFSSKDPLREIVECSDCCNRVTKVAAEISHAVANNVERQCMRNVSWAHKLSGLQCGPQKRP